MNRASLLPPYAAETNRRPGADAPEWVPCGRTVPVPCGRYFDAIRVPADIAEPALRILGPQAGPVLANTTTRAYHFLVLRPNRVSPGAWGRGIRVMPQHRLLGIPPAHTTGGRDVHWAFPPSTYTTPSLLLREVLEGPLPLATRPSPPAVVSLPASVDLPPCLKPLPPTAVQLRIGALLLAGENEEQMAVRMGMYVGTVRRHLTQLGKRIGATTSTGRVTALLTGGHLPPPPVNMLAPDLSPLDLQILRVVAGLDPAGLLPEHLRSGQNLLDHVTRLRNVTGARTDAHLVALAVAWDLLPGGAP